MTAEGARGGRIWGLLWLISAVATFAVEAWAIFRSSVPYSIAEQAISDLGQTVCEPVTTYPDGPVDVCSPEHDVLNIVWIVTGLLIAIAAIALRHRLGSGRSALTAAVLLALGGLGQAGAGLVPTDQDLNLHALLAGVGILAQNAGLIAAGVSLRRKFRGLGSLAWAAGIVGIVANALIFAPTSWGLPFGIVERIAVYPFLIWLAIAGARFSAARTAA